MTDNRPLEPAEIGRKLNRFWDLSGEKINNIDAEYDYSIGSPVFTLNGKYTTRGWTEWTEGFVYGSSILQFDAADSEEFIKRGKDLTVQRMAKHVTHMGVHDHGFNNVSTYGNLLRLMNEGKIEENTWERAYYELALKCSGAVQAARWSPIADGGYIYSFNGPHSLFADTIRSLRSLAVAHQMGHVLMMENDTPVYLLERLIEHAKTTADYIVYYGEGRDSYDIRGRVVHEAIFNMNDGRFRCPSTQQGYSPFSTWTRGLAWIITGYAEQLEYISGIEVDGTQSPKATSGTYSQNPELNGRIFERFGGKEAVLEFMKKAAIAAADFYIENTPTDYIPYWDTGAPGLVNLGAYLEKPANPFNGYEPVDSSAAAIAAQGFLRLGRYLKSEQKSSKADAEDKNIIGAETQGDSYINAGLKILDTLLDEPYLSVDPQHQGLLLHTVYHRPNGWDGVPEGAQIPSGESCMWGDYHLREAALYFQKLIANKPYYTFWLT